MLKSKTRMRSDHQIIRSSSFTERRSYLPSTELLLIFLSLVHRQSFDRNTEYPTRLTVVGSVPPDSQLGESITILVAIQYHLLRLIIEPYSDQFLAEHRQLLLRSVKNVV